MKTVVTMGPDGRLTVPEEARQAMQVNGELVFELEVIDHTLVLRPTDILAEDAWAYTPEHLERVKRALSEGGGRQLPREDLERLIADGQR